MISKEVRKKKRELLYHSNPKCIVNIIGHELPHWQGKRLFFSIHDYGKYGISLSVSGPRGAPYGQCFVDHKQFERIAEKIIVSTRGRQNEDEKT